MGVCRRFVTGAGLAAMIPTIAFTTDASAQGLPPLIFGQPADDENEPLSYQRLKAKADKAAKAYQRQPFKLVIGGGAFAAPTYLGGSKYEIGPMPIVDVNWRDIVWLRGRTLGLNLYKNKWVTLGPVIRVDTGRDSSDSTNIKGMHDINPTAEVGGFVEGKYKKVSLRLAAYQDVAQGHGGTVVRTRLQYSTRFLIAFHLQANVFANWASSPYMDSYFSVTPDDASKTKFTTYKAKAGFRDVGSSLALTFSFAEHWGVVVRGRYARLVGDAADSPIVKEGGSANQYFLGAGIFYRY